MPTSDPIKTLLWAACVCSAWLACELTANAQEDLFDAPAGIFGGPAEPAPKSKDLDEDPLAQQLIERSRRGNLELAESVNALARTGRWAEVDQLLAKISSANIAAGVQAEMYGKIGPAIFLRLKGREDLSDAARAALDKLAASAVAEAESPQRLRQAIDGLDDSSIDVRLASARALLGGGNVSIVELVAAAVSAAPPAPRDEILRAMSRLGSGGEESLRQLALYGTPEVRSRALESLARLDRDAHVVEFLSALHAVDASAAEVAIASSALRQLAAGLPSRNVAIEILHRDLQNKRQDAAVIDNDDQVQTLWTTNDERTGVTHQPTRLMFAAYRDAADAAYRLRRLGELPSEVLTTVLATEMAYRVIVDPDWGDPAQRQEILAAYGDALTASALSAAIDEALAGSDYPAAVGLIRLINPAEASVFDRTVLLQSRGSSPTPLVLAASSRDPRVRYEAALAAAQLAAGAAYPGSSYVRESLGEMQRLGDQPTAILVETRLDVTLRLEKLLRDLGFRVESVGSVGQLQRRVARGGDLRMILSKTELADLAAIEMVDRVRRMERGHDVPIVFYGSETAGIGHGRWSTPTVLIDQPKSTLALDLLLNQLELQSRLQPLSVVYRQRYRTAAAGFLAEASQTH